MPWKTLLKPTGNWESATHFFVHTRIYNCDTQPRMEKARCEDLGGFASSYKNTHRQDFCFSGREEKESDWSKIVS